MTSKFTLMHHVFPNPVYAKYHKLIDQVTNGEFNQNAMYNIVFLFIDAEEALREGTVMYGTDIDPLINRYSEELEKMAQESDPKEQLKIFQGLHSYFRSALFLNECENPTYVNKNDLHWKQR